MVPLLTTCNTLYKICHVALLPEYRAQTPIPYLSIRATLLQIEHALPFQLACPAFASAIRLPLFSSSGSSWLRMYGRICLCV